jgi:hypothetical protein
MNKSKVALGLTLAAIYQHAWSSGFLDDSKASVSVGPTEWISGSQ